MFDSLLDSSPIKKEFVKGTDILFYRELTSGIYFGEPRGRNDEKTEAWDTLRYTEREIERLVRKGFEASMRRKKKVTPKQ